MHLLQKEIVRTKSGLLRYGSIDAVVFISERHATVVHDALICPITMVFGQSAQEEVWKQNVVDDLTKR